ncbi:hypothetical protein EON81_20775 [bacterium]|nr:MAG: hypothetical protein EON81_20775 [bacterium]
MPLDCAATRCTIPKAGEVGYLASPVSDFLRRKMMERDRWFFFETVMSSRNKVELMRQAQGAGYRTYLYYIATDDVRINIERVAARVQLNGHNVPEAKIRARYLRSLELLAEAIHYANRAYLFDNSGDKDSMLWVGEITEGRILNLKTQNVPEWVEKYVIDPMTGGQA